MEFLDESKLEAMTCGPFNNCGYYGYKSSVLKSGICKYFRREQFEKLEWCVVEMFLFGLKNSGIMTNVINRLKILIMEELVFSELGAVVRCIELVNMIDSEEDTMKKLCLSISLTRIASTCKKGRIVSYVNNWWKFHSEEKTEKVKLKKIIRFRKEGDSDELLEYGELMIRYIVNRDERMFEVFTILFDMKDKMGKRYRRSDAIYLFWEIVEKYYCYEQMKGSKLKILNTKKKKLFDFALGMFHRKNMKERKSFGIWMGLFVIWGGEGEIILPPIPEVSIEELLKDRKKISIDEHYVVKDFHVNRKFGLSTFGTTGAYVENEDTECLGVDHGSGDVSKVMKYREYYKLQKDRQEHKIQDTSVPEFMSGKEIDSNETLNFRIIKVLEEGVCGLKKCCILVKNLKTQEKQVVKEMPKSMNYGIDYLFMDELKESFGLHRLGMVRMSSRTNLSVVDKSIKSFVKNWKYNHTNTTDVYYCVMDFKENIGDLGKHKEVLQDDSVKEETLKIRLFNGLFGTSDNILRNILVGADRKILYSIDENDIYGKRKNIFNKNDWCLKDSWCLSNVERVWKELLENIDVEEIKDMFRKYNLEDKIEEFNKRLEYTKEDLIRV
tara:strand:- start:2515 stop:4344 length:1830 start_codon:yes stop_codon:yes gene_type:complete